MSVSTITEAPAATLSNGLLERFSKVATVIMADRITKAAAIDKFGR